MSAKILLVSFGSIGKRHLRNARNLLPDAQIAVYRQHTRGSTEVPEGADAICYDHEAAQRFAPDAVIISSPASEHVKHARAFLDLGAHAFIEKPLAAEYSQVEALLASSSRHDRFAMVGYVLRFQPLLRFLKHYLAQGSIGKVLTARVEVGQYLPDWRPDSDYRLGVSGQRALGGGALLELSHELDYATWLFGMPNHLFCSSGTLSDLDIDVEDSACVVMEYGQTRAEKRVVVNVDFLQRVATMAVQVVGSEATLMVDLIAERAYLRLPGVSGDREIDVPRMADGNEMYLRQFDFFFTRCFAGYEARYPDQRDFTDFASIARAADVLRVVDLAKRSNQSGQRLILEGCP